MTVLLWLAGLIGGGALALLAWASVHSLRQARLLSGWRRPSLDGLDGRAAALRGEVRVSDPLLVRGVGECLWHRRIVNVQQAGAPVAHTDVAERAGFSIAVDDRLFAVRDFPTEVAGALKRHSNANDEFIHLEWIPRVDHLTIVGRVQRTGPRWEIVKDSTIGLIYSTHSPERTALREWVKGGLGVLAVAIGLAALVWILNAFQ